MMAKAAMAGLYGFVVTAVFVGGWMLVVIVLGLLGRLLAGSDGDEDDE